MKRKTWMLVAAIGVGVFLYMRYKRAAALPAPAVVPALLTGAVLDKAINEGSVIH
jgi:hypothetical protein